jgi:RNA ligase
MKYPFPIIDTIEAVLPAIEGRDEFIVAERDGFIVVNYNVGFEDTFPPIKVSGGSARMRSERAHLNAMRRECRGIIFYPDGRLMSRPFHKFFNFGEREETLLHNIDMSQNHVVMEKMDGSMIRPLDIHGKLRLGTKMGTTDIAQDAEHCLRDMANVSPAEWDLALSGHVQNKYIDWFEMCRIKGLTPLFEYVSPHNRIVVEYNKPDLVLLAIRENRTGIYHNIEDMRGNDCFTVVPTYGQVEGNLVDYIAKQREGQGREGFIAMFADGHMLKGKNDWYVRIHKVKDQIRSDRHVLALLLNNELDDIYPQLDKADFDRIKKYEVDFHAAYRAKSEYLLESILTLIALAKNKKQFATEILPNGAVPNKAHGFAFKMYDRVETSEHGFMPREYMNKMLMDYVHSHLGSTVKYNEMVEFIGLTGEEV